MKDEHAFVGEGQHDPSLLGRVLGDHAVKGPLQGCDAVVNRPGLQGDGSAEEGCDALT